MTTDEKLTLVAENPQKVYDAGYAKGKAEGVDGYYDTFWDFYLYGGKRGNHGYAFYGDWWNDTTFRPPCNITLGKTSTYVFAESDITDLKGILEELGVTIDWSQVTNMSNAFTWSSITRMPVMNLSSVTSVYFYYAYMLESVDKVILNQDGSQSFNFQGVGELKEIRFEGVIGKNIDMSACKKLTAASIESVLSVLSTTATKQTATFSKTAVEAAFTTEEWDALVAAKPNWTIAKA